ncbi:hypothetical protein D3C80_1408830 [compost metagenome]
MNDLVENITVLVNGTPKPVFAASDGNHHLVQMPDVPVRRPPATDLLCVGRSEFPPPSADRFIRNDDAALQQQFLDQAQAQREPKVQPDCMGDDLLRETVALVADG